MGLLNESFAFEYGFYEFSIVVRIEYAMRPMKELYLIHGQDHVIFTSSCPFDLVPLDGHTLLGIEFDQNLLAAYLITQSLKK